MSTDTIRTNLHHKIGASILSNDSYQEFQDDYKWLFAEGRLYGGKPVPHVGWVFIQRIPVRPLAKKIVKKASREANRPMPVPKALEMASLAANRAARCCAGNFMLRQ